MTSFHESAALAAVPESWSRTLALPELERPGLLHAIFEEQARARPDALAVIAPDGSLRYGELDQRAGMLAAALRGRGIGPGHVVAFWLPRSLDLYVALLGVLKSGAAYLPLDPDWPQARVEEILRDSDASLLLTHGARAAPCETMRLEEKWEPPARAAFVETVEPGDLCYVIYTSGSTGKPKGVAIEHRSAAHLVYAEQHLFEVGPSDRVFQGFSIAFDAAVEEIWLAFAAGATLVAATRETMLSSLPAFLREHAVTIFSTVPTLLSGIREDLPGVRLLILGGETCPQSIADRWAHPGRRVFNTYGPTEATVIATCAELKPGRTVTIGQPVPDYSIYLLDGAGRLTPPGEPGEIAIGGPGLARGYLGNDLLTASKFVRSPYAPRLYRTGDRGRFDVEGNLEFLGRIDDQVKVRGYRIELGEIEAALADCEGVQQAAATVREGVLVGYIVGTAAEDALKGALRSRLPPYMIPAHVETLERMPVSSSGKLDRRALPAPRISSRRREQAPANAIEARLERVWAELLGVASVSCADDFFLDLGGHSLLAAELISTLREEFGDLSVLDLYRNPTIAGLARQCTVCSTQAVAARAPVPCLRHLACAAAQTAGLYLLFGLNAAQWLAPYLAWSAFDHSLPLASLAILALHPALLLTAIAFKWAVVGRARPGRYPLWSGAYLRWWFVDRVLSLAPTGALVGTPLINLYYRALGARVGRNAFIGTDAIKVPDLVSIGDDSALGMESSLRAAVVEDGMLVLETIQIGYRCTVGTAAMVAGGATMSDEASLGELSLLPRGGSVPRGEHWAGSPAQPSGAARADFAQPAPLQRVFFGAASTLCLMAIPLFTLSAAAPGMIALQHFHAKWGGVRYLFLSPLVALFFVLIVALNVAAAKWLLLGRVAPGRRPLFGSFHLRWWIFGQAMRLSLEVAGGLFATLFLNPWYRLLGVRLGRHAEVSTAVAHAPDLLEIGDDAFIADAASLGAPRFSRGTVELSETSIGKRSFIGNSAVVPGGRRIDDDCLVGCLSSAPAESRPGKSWFGSPAVELPQRQSSAAFSLEETFRPRPALIARRLAIESLRVLLPPTIMVVLTCLTLSAADSLPLALVPLPGIAAGAAAALFVVAMKWLLMGRYRPAEKPLWSGFVWRTELVTALHENLADPLFNEMLMGTPFAPWFYRALGARIGKRVWLGTSYFTEYDLVEIGDDASIDEEATIQTHLFEDRVMKMSRIRIGDRCTVGAGAVVLYDSTMRDGAGLGPLSLLMKGETLPAASSWQGSPARSRLMKS